MSAVVGAGLTIVGLAASTSSATANWQYTQWNMTPAEVKTASQGAVQDNSARGLDAPNRKAQLTAPYQGEATPFKAAFLFNEENELKDVALTPIKKATARSLDLLRKHYGQLKENSDYPLRCRSLPTCTEASLFRLGPSAAQSRVSSTPGSTVWLPAVCSSPRSWPRPTCCA